MRTILGILYINNKTLQKLISRIRTPTADGPIIENLKSALTRRIEVAFSSVFSSVVESDYQAYVTCISNDNNYYNYKFTFYANRAWDTLEIVREKIIVQFVARYT